MTSTAELSSPASANTGLTHGVTDPDAWAAAIDDQTPELLVWSGAGDGTFSAPSSRPLPSPAVRVHAARLDANDTVDLVAATFAAGDVTVLLTP